MADRVRYGLLLRTCLEVLKDTGKPVPGTDVLAEVERRVDLNDEELQVHKTGGAKWIVALGFSSGDAATAGWLVKRDGRWWITEAGIAALDTYRSPEEFIREVSRRYQEVFRSRTQARKKYVGVLHDLANALERLPAGSWTSYDDLAELVAGDAEEIAHLLGVEALPNSHRVLTPGGYIPEARFQHASYRGTDLRDRLETEGIEFRGDAASLDQRITAELLKEQLASAVVEVDPPGRRAWLVRGSNVDGADLVPVWLTEGWMSLAAPQLPVVEFDVGERRLREMVANAYRHKSYSVREKLTGEFDAFLRQMSEGDYLVTVHRGEAHLGLVDGPPSFADSSDRRSNLRRPVRWLTNAYSPLGLTELEAPLPTLIQSQDDVVDLTDGLAALERLYAPLLAEAPPAPAPAQARLEEISDKLVERLLMEDASWLQGVRDLLAERRQIILCGPPGTGKTYLAQHLATSLTEPHAVKLVQFHPSYTYEDFFEGFRPESSEDGTLRFQLTSGPLRKLADDAREHPSTAYILIIDEINRGNLAKIFGELYFLLEYRDQRISLQYSQGDFTLPPNLYLIGTMNTADRSIALVDAAMRRRFAFVEMHPSKPPVAGVLRRWLVREGIDSDAAELHDALNARLQDADYAIGPSYFMRGPIYSKPEGIETVWQHDLLPLLVEHHYADDVDVEVKYGLDVLRASLQ